MNELQQRLQEALGTAYTLERELGGGGMSRTYLATEHALSRRVVVKVLPPELLAGISIERFNREVLLAAGLQHPHVVPVLSAGDADGLPWFTMPYVDGDSLRARLAQGALPIGEATGILRDVARALEYAHARGVVHRDIKPDNVLLAGSSATVTDFGIAKAITASRTPQSSGGGTVTALTAVGTSIGTPTYMPPEQAAGDPNLDHRSDIYAFGVMAYELLAGRPPFVADNPSRLIAAHFNEAPRDVRELRPDTPPALAELVMRCLAKTPDGRPQDARELVRILDGVSSTGGTVFPAAAQAPQLQLGRALSLWGGATAIVGVTAWAATRTIGLPDWAFPGAVGTMLAGLPAVLGTWYVQRTTHRILTSTPTRTPGGSAVPQGTMATMAMKAAPHVSWRRTWMGGAVAAGSFATLVVAFMVLRALGVGPMGSLMAKGTFKGKESLVVADFRPPPGDSALGATVSEAIRTDLAQSRHLSVMSRATLRDMMRLIGKGELPSVFFDDARTIATREGAKAVLDGAVDRLGPGFVVSARLVGALDGAELATFRATAKDESELIAALGSLSHDIREKVGESLRDIRDAASLERVTTASLPALRKYVEATDILSSTGNTDRAQALLREAIALDTTFAMAWRRLASSFAGTGRGRDEQLRAIVKAFAYRDRLSELERLLTEASYYSFGPIRDENKAIAAYEGVLAIDSLSSAALNNVGTRYAGLGELDKAIDRMERATRLQRPFGGSFTNLVQYQLWRRDLPGAESTLVRFKRALPANGNHWVVAARIAAARGQIDSMGAIATASYRDAKTASQRDQASFFAGAAEFLGGRPSEALRWFSQGNVDVSGPSRSKVPLLLAGLDTAFKLALYDENPAAARAAVTRALARVPIESIEPADRPWDYLGEIAAEARDAKLGQVALAGLAKDSAVSGTPTSAMGRMRYRVAIAAGDYAEAIAQIRAAVEAREATWRAVNLPMARAFDIADRPDSALFYYERYASNALSDIDSEFHVAAGTFKRLGELYDAKGDKAKAAEYYQRFVDLWKNAEPSLQPKVRKVRERLAELRRTTG